MKPRNFITNILLTMIFVAQIILSAITPAWQMLFFGVVGVILLIPDWFLRVKHKKGYITHKSIQQALIILVGLGCSAMGFLFCAIYDVAESLAEGCGGTVSHSELDKFSAQFSMLIFIPVLVKVTMNIIDFSTYKKDKRNLMNENTENL